MNNPNNAYYMTHKAELSLEPLRLFVTFTLAVHFPSTPTT